MKLKVFTIYDKAVEAYSPPFFARATGQALRDFIEEVNNPQSRISKSPEHFALFDLGTFDDSNGQFDLFTSPRLVANAHEHKATGGTVPS